MICKLFVLALRLRLVMSADNSAECQKGRRVGGWHDSSKKCNRDAERGAFIWLSCVSNLAEVIEL